jgi:hypothetical protein
MDDNISFIFFFFFFKKSIQGVIFLTKGIYSFWMAMDPMSHLRQLNKHKHSG